MAFNINRQQIKTCRRVVVAQNRIQGVALHRNLRPNHSAERNGPVFECGVRAGAVQQQLLARVLGTGTRHLHHRTGTVFSQQFAAVRVWLDQQTRPAQGFEVLRLGIQHRVVGPHIDIKPRFASKKALHQLLFNGRLVAELLDALGGEVGTLWHVLGLVRKARLSMR